MNGELPTMCIYYIINFNIIIIIIIINNSSNINTIKGSPLVNHKTQKKFLDGKLQEGKGLFRVMPMKTSVPITHPWNCGILVISLQNSLHSQFFCPSLLSKLVPVKFGTTK